MMEKDAQKFYTELLKKQARVKQIKAMLREEYTQIPEHVDLINKRNALMEMVKQIRLSVDEQYPKEIAELEDLKIDIESDREFLNDLVLTKFAKGETIELKNHYDQPCLPIFTVRFVKER